MRKYHEMVKIIRQFLDEQHMSAFDLCKISKELCCCNTCRFYVPHYSREGSPLDWGHCDRGGIQHSKKPSSASCGYWDMMEE